MKKDGKLIRLLRILTFFCISIVIVSCNSHANQEQNSRVSTLDKVNVYYFHFARRCVTCIAVEKESQKAVKELYGDKVSFASYSLNMPDGERLGKQLGIYGQTLLIIYGDKKIDLTAKGFRYARKNPEKLKQILKEKIEPLL